ncbi:MAG: EAL domain-containing protein [Gaiellaceae bacterium]|jgi:diguanylate cyclase (GGDEF)-like protein
MRRLTITAQFGILSALLIGALGVVFRADLYDAITLTILYLAQLVFVARAAHRLRVQVEENEFQALHDTLTSLPNRTLFRDRVEQAILQARREDSRFSLLIMDLDRFKEINDTLGHRNGDLILQAIGPRLRGVLRDVDSIARFGGDEFAVLLPGAASSDAAMRVASKIAASLSRPFMLKGLTLDVEASVGISVFPDHGNDVDTLIQRADVAMYMAKEAHTGFEVYAADRDQYTPKRLALLGELRRALENKELVLFYQPKADIRTGKVHGVEALLRWQHPEHGLTFPDDFIPLAEHTGLIRPLTLYVLNEALEQSYHWQQQGITLNIAVNLSARNLLDSELPDDVAQLLETWHVDPALLKLEITENTIMVDPPKALEVLTRLRDLGVGLSIDDFGTGYSSLSYLRKLPVDELKIDRSFVMNMPQSENDQQIVRSTIDLSRNLGLKVVAEGVETKEIWRDLAALGCDVAQGYYLTRPIPPQELVEWLARPIDAPVLEKTRAAKKASGLKAV